jgi:hypothetical protein
VLLLALAVALSACGGGSGSSGHDEPAVAYVVSKCSEDARGLRSFQQALYIRQGEHPPVTVMELSYPPTIVPGGICTLYGTVRFGGASTFAGAFQRLGVTGNGDSVVFEVTDDFSFFTPDQLIPPDQESSVEGIFVVRADGSGLRRLGPASRNAAFRFFVDPSSPYGFNGRVNAFFAANPDGTVVAFTDIGPDAAGQEAIQIFTLDIVTGERLQVTQLPPSPEPDVEPFTSTTFPYFISDETLRFYSFSNPNGLNPDGEYREFEINADGTDLQALPLPVALPGAQLVPVFQIVGGPGARAATIVLPDEEPVNQVPFLSDTVAEVFVRDGDNLLQLTNFHRVDTGSVARFLSRDRRRVLFAASVDHLGTNPTENCQFFSIEKTGRNLRQITHFQQGGHSSLGCSPAGPPPGCAFGDVTQDPTGAIRFTSSCDPFGTNANGSELFVMNEDGTDLRQLTDTEGMVTGADGSITVELVGPAVAGLNRDADF